MRAVVTGMIATFPLGGVAWDYCQYAAGFERLGLEVYYLEDTGLPTYVVNTSSGELELNCDYGALFLEQSLSAFSPTLGRRWHFRSFDNKIYGLSADAFAEIIAEADILINVSGGTLLREPYRRCARKIFIDTDPGWNHFVIFPRWEDKPAAERPFGFRSHDFFFTFAERMGQPDCPLPDYGLRWHATRHPVLPEFWEPLPPGERYTTIMTWNAYDTVVAAHGLKPVEYAGVRYGSKEMEFDKIEQLPNRVQVSLELAVNGANAPRERLQELGWSVISGPCVSRTAETYNAYIAGSRGELSVAKNIYVATKSGWFSGRSACYLAAGRPVILQDTGFSEVIPIGEGLLAFSNVDEAAASLELVETNYDKHSRRAREAAETYFDGRLVLLKMLSDVGL